MNHAAVDVRHFTVLKPHKEHGPREVLVQLNNATNGYKYIYMEINSVLKNPHTKGFFTLKIPKMGILATPKFYVNVYIFPYVGSTSTLSRHPLISTVVGTLNKQLPYFVHVLLNLHGLLVCSLYCQYPSSENCFPAEK